MTNFNEAMDELAMLLDKIEVDEDLIERLELFYAERLEDWSDEFIAHFEKFLERKREQLYFEQTRAERLGWRIALEHDPDGLDI